MNNIPAVFKIILNIIFYIIYTLLFSIIFSLIFPLVLQFFWKEIYPPNDPIFAKIQIVIIILTLFITIIFRKYFYIIFDKKEEKIYRNDIIKNKNQKTKVDNDLSENDELEIYVWREKK